MFHDRPRHAITSVGVLLALSLIFPTASDAVEPDPAGSRSEMQAAQPSREAENKPGSLYRSIGGISGAVMGGVGGAALASLLIRAGGSSLMMGGPLPAIIGITAGSLLAYGGAKVLSHAGQEIDHAVDSKSQGAMVGAVGGFAAGAALIPKLAQKFGGHLTTAGAFAGPAGRVTAGVLGAAALGAAGHLLSDKVDIAAKPPVMTAIGGAVAGTMAFGIPGAIGGLVLGGIAGVVLDKVFFADRKTRVRDLWDRTVETTRNPRKLLEATQSAIAGGKPPSTSTTTDTPDPAPPRWGDRVGPRDETGSDLAEDPGDGFITSEDIDEAM